MSYLSTLPEGIREKKEKQLKMVLGKKPELFSNLNYAIQPKKLEEDTINLLNKLPEERKELFERLYNKFEASIKSFDVKDLIKGVEIPDHNTISFVPLFENTIGENHYASVYLDLLLYHETQGDIIPGYTRLLETSSGSGGISCSKIAKELGYQCTIAIPGGGEKVREDAIKSNEAELILTDGEKYVGGFPAFLKNYIRQNLKDFRDKKIFFLSHMQGEKNKNGNFENNNKALIALSKVAYKILKEYREKGKKLDYIVSGIGNGTNTLGIGGPLHLHGVKVIGFEPFESGITYEKLHPGRYEQEFGIRNGELGRHNMPGMSHKVDFNVPHLENSIDILDEVYLTGDKKTEEKYENTTGKKIPSEGIIFYDKNTYDLSEWGRSTKAGFYVAMKLAEKLEGKNIVFLGYDRGNRYDDYQSSQK